MHTDMLRHVHNCERAIYRLAQLQLRQSRGRSRALPFLDRRVNNRHAEMQGAFLSMSRARQCAPKTALTVAEIQHHIEDFSACPNCSEHKLAVCPQCGCNAFDGRLCAEVIGIRLNCFEKQQACAAALILTQG